MVQKNAAAKKQGAGSGDLEMLLVGSKTKEALKAFEVNVAADALESLNALVHWYIAQAAARAAANGRKTIRGHDFAIFE